MPIRIEPGRGLLQQPVSWFFHKSSGGDRQSMMPLPLSSPLYSQTVVKPAACVAQVSDFSSHRLQLTVHTGQALRFESRV